MASFALQTSNVAVGNDSTSVHCFRTLADGIMRIGLDDDSFANHVYFDGIVSVTDQLIADSVTSNTFTTNVFTSNVFASNVFTANAFTANAITTVTISANAVTSNVITANVISGTGLTVQTADVTDLLTVNNFTVTNAFTTTTNAVSNVFTANVATISGNLTANNATISNVLTANVVTLSGALNIAGVTETITEFQGATGVVVHDFTTGALWRHSIIYNNFTINLTNVPTTVSKVTSVNLILVQGGTAYYANACQIAGVSQTINWLGAALPTATASGTDIQNLTLVRSAAGAWSVMSSLSGFKTAA